MEKELQTDCQVQPLAAGIPAEKWDEYVASENEKARKQKEAELEAIEQKKREEEERLRKEQEELAAASDPYRRIDGVITLKVPPIEPYNCKPLVLPTPEKLFPDDGVHSSGIAAVEPQKSQSPGEKERPLTPQFMSALLSQTTVPFLNAVQNHLESHMEYQTTEALSRITKLATERIMVRVKEKEEEELAAQKAAAEKARQIASAKDKKAKDASAKADASASGGKKGTPPDSKASAGKQRGSAGKPSSGSAGKK
ncbi:hypothetical protein HDU97_006185 [Phlyctochytrium planicorne]|nr:hypothetical protein HDU97_006185 [Phlyctochytrium planicorne]